MQVPRPVDVDPPPVETMRKEATFPSVCWYNTYMEQLELLSGFSFVRLRRTPFGTRPTMHLLGRGLYPAE